MPRSRELATIRQKLVEILDERDRLFPVRAPKNTEAMNSAMDEYHSALSVRVPPQLQLDPSLAERALDLKENLVVVCGSMKSGTTLLVELLDGHPALHVMPGDSHMLSLLEQFAALPLLERPGAITRHWVQRMINPKGQVPFWTYGADDGPYLEFLSWMEHWLRALGDDARGSFLAAVLAHYCANPRRPLEPRLWVEKTPGNELRVEQIVSRFPRARFIHVFREPLSNVASLKKLYEVRGWRWSALQQAARMRRSFEAALSNRERLGNRRYHLCRYEDLVRHPETTLRSVAAFCGIEYVPALLRPTINGLPTKANSMHRERQVLGVIRRRTHQDDSNGLRGAERDAVMAYTAAVAQAAGYAYPPHRVLLARGRVATRRLLDDWRAWLSRPARHLRR